MNYRISKQLICIAVIVLSCSAPKVSAAILWSGDVQPSNPSTWTSSTVGYIGKTSTGSITVDGGSNLLSQEGNLGYSSGSSGTVTVSGVGSTWTNYDMLSVGDMQGTGTLNIQAGGQVISQVTDLGYQGSSGTVTITGAGSNLTNKYSLTVGGYGQATLSILAGGQASNSDGYICYGSGSTATVTVSDAGSKWINTGNLKVSNYNSHGTLTVTNGGAVTVGKAIFASLNNLQGNGSITANGAVIDADLVFDSAHGTQNTFNFGSGGTLTITPNGSGALGAGYLGNGSLRIADGVAVASSEGYLGYLDGAYGTAIVTGAGSTWTNSGTLYIGQYTGHGALTIEAGGQVVNAACMLGNASGASNMVTVTGAGSKWTNNGDLYVSSTGGKLTVADGGSVIVQGGLFASLSNLDGDGVISANGGTLDVDLVFDAAHGLQNSIPFGTGGTLNIHPNNTAPLGVGYLGTGTLIIADGKVINSAHTSYLGFYGGSNGTATVTGAGSQWNISNGITVGYMGNGSLNITAGGLISSSTVSLGDMATTTGSAVISGAGSQWNVNNGFQIGHYGNGSLKIEAGGQLNVTADNAYGNICLGSNLGSSGTATVTGDGSKWINSGGFSLNIGNIGNGTLKIEAGGFVSNSMAILGSASGATGTAIISGPGSKWINSSTLFVGYDGNGTMTIEAGGQVENADACVAYDKGSSGTVTVTGAGSKWTTNGDLSLGPNAGSIAVTDGATLIVTKSIYANLANLNGDGAISANGAVIDANLVFDSAHGLQNTLGYGTGGTMTITVVGTSALGIGYAGTGTLNIAEGIAANSTNGYLGYCSGSSGTATVTGDGSQWTNSRELYVGKSGSGTLKIEAGGQVNDTTGYVAYSKGSSGDVIVSGTNSKWTNSSLLYLGEYGNATLKIEGGGQVGNTSARLGDYSGAQGTATVTGGGSQWNCSGSLSIGNSGNGTLNIDAGGQVSNSYSYLGNYSGSSGLVTVSGAGSIWTNSSYIEVGYSGNGEIDISGGGQVSDTGATLGYDTHATGIVTVSGTSSKWTNSGSVSIGTSGNGSLCIDAGGQVSNTLCYVAYNSGSVGSVKVSGDGSTWTNSGALYVGYYGKGSLDIEAGGQVSNTSGYIYGRASAVTVAGANSKWTNSGDLNVGQYESVTLTIAAGGQVSNANCVVGYSSYSGLIETVTVNGAGSKWINSGTLDVGKYGKATFTIADGGQVSNTTGYLADTASATGTATVTDAGSKWTNNGDLYIGRYGSGSLTIAAGGQVEDNTGYLSYSSSSSAATVTGAGSKWIHSKDFYVANFGKATLLIDAGGQVNNANGYVGYAASNSNGAVTVSGAGSVWNNSGSLYIGSTGSGSLTVTDGGVVNVGQTLFASLSNLQGNGVITANGIVLDGNLVFDDAHGLQQSIPFGTGGVVNLNLNPSYPFGIGYKSTGTLTIANGISFSLPVGYLGYTSSANGTATVTGNGSKWSVSDTLYVGYAGRGTLNIESGATVAAKNLMLGNSSYNQGTCNLDGGVLQVGTITAGSTNYFNWTGGTIRNYDANTDLTMSSYVSITLAGSGAHTFYIDTGRTGTVNFGYNVFADSPLIKEGGGLLKIASAPNYTGNTIVSAGTLAMSVWGSLSSSLIDVNRGATLDVSAAPGSLYVVYGQTLQGAGTIIGNLYLQGIHAPGSPLGIETVQGNYTLAGQLNIELAGTTAGTDYDQVLLSGGTGNYKATISGALSLDWSGMSGSTDTTQLWILKNDTKGALSGKFSNYLNGADLGYHDGHEWFIWYGADAASGKLIGGNDLVIAAVPEPSMIAMLGLCCICLLARAWRIQIKCR